MTEKKARENVLKNIAQLKKWGVIPVVVHGGGPFIKNILSKVGIESAFIGGHRKTDSQAIKYVEMALRGQVNGVLVKHLNHYGCRAVGLSGKDGQTVSAKKRIHKIEVNGQNKTADLGHVGDVSSINPELLHILIKGGYTPVMAPVAVDNNMKDYNINADMFAGHLAGALKARAFVALTNVDGLLEDVDKPDSIIHEIDVQTLKTGMSDIVKGGMIPKVEACMIAILEGAEEARIVNGLTNNAILHTLLGKRKYGTQIH